jgi:hypothetical protein
LRLSVRRNARIPDTRVLPVPAVMNAAIGVDVERDIAARPVHDRTGVQILLVAPRAIVLCASIMISGAQM